MNTISIYNSLNKIAKKHGIVLLGSTFAYNLPLNELVQNYSLSQKIYNRSLQGLHIKDAEQYVNNCIVSLEPNKLIINLGDEELNSECDIIELIEAYRWLLYRIHTLLPETVLFITSVDESKNNAHSFNTALKQLAKELGCGYIKTIHYDSFEESAISFFKSIKTSLYDASGSFSNLAAKAILDSMVQY